ncbi:MAG: two-component system, OmpR family, operon response regulator KdpE [Chloroflexota bacterium]|nr:two-component system, OmpR family, operon response regulator KdpE [Chloroflexota bacterium]
MTRAAGVRILVVDDDPGILRTVQANLRGHGFDVETAATGGAALEAYARARPDLILLDLELPDVLGFDVIRAIRAEASTPIVVLSVRDAEAEKVTALDLGADDYLTKPFGVGELMARLRVALRHVARPAQGAAAIFRTGGLAVDLEHRRVTVGGAEVHLTPTEYDLLKVFLSHPDKVLTDRMLLQQVWGPNYGEEAHYLHVYVARLRKKIEQDPQNPSYLMTEPGVGYRLLTGEQDER